MVKGQWYAVCRKGSGKGSVVSVCGMLSVVKGLVCCL